MNKYKVNPAEYDFLWKVNNQSYFLTSFWMHDEYIERDFIFTNCGDVWETYIGKKERERTSELGYKLMSDRKKFSEFQNAAKRITAEMEEYFKKFRSLKYQKLSDRQLADELIAACLFCTRAWRQYFITEFFYYDKVEKMLQERSISDAKLKLIESNVHKMQEIKFDLRSKLNETAFGDHLFVGIIKEAAKRLKLKSEDIYYKLGYKEIADILLDKKTKIKFKETYVMGKFSNWEIIEGKEAEAIIDSLRNYTKKHVGNVLRGQIGNKGFYVGRVKIVPFDLKADLHKEINKMKKGDVLVSGTTGPEMIMACRKAGAIVTEEGGIISHAAIVSRELKIPAVIGTKIATKVLKDGDLVEVSGPSLPEGRGG